MLYAGELSDIGEASAALKLRDAAGEEIGQRILRRRRGDQRQLTLRPVQSLSQRSVDDRQRSCPSPLKNIAYDGGEGCDLDPLQIHAAFPIL